jgi:hypothetical protein
MILTSKWKINSHTWISLWTFSNIQYKTKAKDILSPHYNTHTHNTNHHCFHLCSKCQTHLVGKSVFQTETKASLRENCSTFLWYFSREVSNSVSFWRASSLFLGSKLYLWVLFLRKSARSPFLIKLGGSCNFKLWYNTIGKQNKKWKMIYQIEQK